MIERDAERPTVVGASPVCLDCNQAGIRNCLHFDNCDGTWVYKPQPVELSAEDVHHCLHDDDGHLCNLDVITSNINALLREKRSGK